jgi:hypothetical protein
MAEATKRKVEAKKKKLERARLKAERDVQKAQRLADAAALKAFKDKWSSTTVAKAGQELHDHIKSRVLPPPGAYTPPFFGVIPRLCKDNQRYRKARMWAKKHEQQLLQDIPSTTAPSWAHRGDHSFEASVHRGGEVSNAGGLRSP